MESEKQNFYRGKVSNIPDAVVAKWNKEVLDEGYIPFPKKLLRSMTEIWDKSPAIKELAIILSAVDFSRANYSQRPSKEYLAFVAGLDMEDFEEAYARLKKKKLIKIKRILPSGEGEVKGTRLDISLEEFFKKIIECTDDD